VAGAIPFPLSGPEEEYDGFAKLANNENPYGPPDSVMKAMTRAMKYANRYGYPDGGIVDEIATHHGVKTENVLLAAGSGEILDVCGTTFLQNDRVLLGADPSYNIFYAHATALKADIIKVPLLPDFRQDIPTTILAARRNARDVGLVYLCNPNNPTGRLVTKDEVRQLLDGIPEDIPVLIDEAYHHFVDDPSYATSVPYVVEGRQVIVARTFSKIAALAGMRLGYALAPRSLIQQMRPYSVGSISAGREVRRRRGLARHGVAGAGQAGDDRASPEDDQGPGRVRLRVCSVRHELLHGEPEAAGRAGDRRVQEERRAGGPPFPAAQRTPPCVHRHRGRDEPIHGRVQEHHDAEHRSQDRLVTPAPVTSGLATGSTLATLAVRPRPPAP
jgi:hypothetical protein